jgi:ribonuclease D
MYSGRMRVITTTSELADFCAAQRNADFITVDTEFVRERTYWAQLCLIQAAGPDEAAIIDVLAPNLDLAPFLELLADPELLKVFHAARQDIEIFVHMTGAVPEPLFDTQIAAMVCGFGDAAGYETLVSKLAGTQIDKSARFTDWAHRPLSQKQLDYAIGDVTHLRRVYARLAAELERSGRTSWLDDEMAQLKDAKTYIVEPVDAWRRLKTRGGNRRFLSILRELAAWREQLAQDRDIPRGRVLRDEALLEIAAQAPRTIDDLARTRGFGRGAAEGKHGTEILACVEQALTNPDPNIAAQNHSQHSNLPAAGPLVDLLRVLLKTRCDEHGVAQKLVANANDLERIANDDLADVPALSGWRRDIFGSDAIALKQGRLALTAEGKNVRIWAIG